MISVMLAMLTWCFAPIAIRVVAGPKFSAAYLPARDPRHGDGASPTSTWRSASPASLGTATIGSCT